MGFAIVLTGCTNLTLARRTPAADDGSRNTTICTEFNNIFFVSIEDASAGDCASFRFFDESIGKMSELKFSNNQPFLGSIVVNTFRGWNWGQENWYAGSIYYYVKPGDRAWARGNAYVFAHEMGHLFLQAYFADLDPVLNGLQNVQKRSFAYYQRLLPILALRQSDPTCARTDSPCARKIKDAVRAWPDLDGPSGDEQIAAFQSQNKTRLDEFLAAVPAYHELFADLFEALYFSDPGVNRKAFPDLGLPAEACRTFDADLPADFDSGNTHCRLSSIRAELWREFVAPFLPDERGILLRVARAIWAETQRQIRKGPLTSGPVAGERLLARLRDVSAP